MSTFLPLIFACNNGGPGDKDAGNDTGPVGTDDTGTPIAYDEGCILVNDRELAWLEDALIVAGDGGTIDLSGCGSTFDQTATVTTSVNIVGPGAEELTWIAPSNEPALTISGASDVSVSGFTLISTRNGFIIDASANVELSGIVYQDIANTAVKATDSSITVSDSTFTAPQYGGVEVSGGTATVTGSTFDAPLAFAVHAIEDAVVTVTDSAISDTMYTNLDNGLVDGFALFGDNGSFVTEGNLLSNNVVHILVTQGNLTMSGDSISDGLYGVYAEIGEIDVDGVSVENATTMGMYLASQNNPVTLTNSTIYGDPDVVYYTADPTAWTGAALIVASNQTATISNLEVEGYNSQGVAVVPYADSREVEVEMDTVTITNTGRQGLYFNNATVTMTDVTVDTLRLVDDPDLVNQDYYETGFGVFANSSDIDWAGGGILDSEVIGLVGQYSTMTFDGITSSGHSDVGLWAIYSTIEVRNSTLSSSPNYGGVANYYGDGIVEDSTFVDNQASWAFEYESYSTTYLSNGSNGNSVSGEFTFEDPDADFITLGLEAGDVISLSGEPSGWNYVASVDSATELTMDYAWTADVTAGFYYIYEREPVVYGYEYSLESLDIACVSGTSMEVRNNTFSTGSQGLYAQACEELVIEDNAWTDYVRGYVLQFSSGTDAKVDNNSIAGAGPYAFYCYDSTVEVDTLSLSEVDSVTIDVSYTRDGADDGGYSYSSSGPALYSNLCSLELADVSITEAHYHAISASNTNFDLSDVEIRDSSSKTSGSSVSVSWDSVEPYFLVEGLDITDPAVGPGLDLSVSDSVAEGTIYLSDLNVSGAPEEGLEITGASAALVDGSLSSNADGIVSVGSHLDLSGTQLSFNTGWGYTASDWDGDGYSIGDGDCEDNNASIYPGAAEATDWVDNDCDGIADDGTDETDIDGDGYTLADGDCDDYDTSRYPGAAEATNGVDSDCDGMAYDATPSSLVGDTLTVTGNGSGGVDLRDLTDASLTSSEVTGNTGYGAVCSSTTTWTTCASTDLSGNTEGEHSGCDACE